ncbi:MAG: OmpA family protein [Thiohalomonadaceae bacterium]
MKTPIRNVRTLVATAVASVALVACSAALTRPDGAADARSKLMQLQADPQLATRAPVAIKEAELAVRAAEQPQQDKEKGEHLVFIADRKVDIAAALAQARLSVDQRQMLSDQREQMRLDARTHEAELARSEAEFARSDAEFARREAASARSATEYARMDALAAQQQADDLQRQIAELNAKATERGLVVTLGDLLFDTGKSELKSGAARNLAKLAAFLNQYKDRSVLIEGHTDSVGSETYNLGLSQRRADSVKSWLVSQGVDPARLVTSGKGESSPVAGNDSASGRQLNRRVEVIIKNADATSR